MVKIERSYPAPESLAIEALKKNGSYREKDVIDRLRDDFHDKCYICEIKGLQDPEVEHLLPHKNGKYLERKFDWDNLFLCCGHCNKVKNNERYDKGIIDCCRRNPEELMNFLLQDGDIVVSAKNEDDEQSVLTAALIYESFNLRNTGIRNAACEYRLRALMSNMNVFYRELERYKKYPDSKRNKRVICSHLRRDSEFAAFKRNYVRERLSEYPALAPYVSLAKE